MLAFNNDGHLSKIALKYIKNYFYDGGYVLLSRFCKSRKIESYSDVLNDTRVFKIVTDPAKIKLEGFPRNTKAIVKFKFSKRLIEKEHLDFCRIESKQRRKELQKRKAEKYVNQNPDLVNKAIDKFGRNCKAAYYIASKAFKQGILINSKDVRKIICNHTKL